MAGPANINEVYELGKKVKKLKAELKAARDDLELSRQASSMFIKQRDEAREEITEQRHMIHALTESERKARERMEMLELEADDWGNQLYKAQERIADLEKSIDFAIEIVQKAGYQQEWNDFHDALATIPEKEGES